VIPEVIPFKKGGLIRTFGTNDDRQRPLVHHPQKCYLWKVEFLLNFALPISSPNMERFLLLTLILAAACGSNPASTDDPNPVELPPTVINSDAGIPDAEEPPAPDGGPPVVDSGPPIQDGGQPPVEDASDAATEPIDAGNLDSGADAGDSGIPDTGSDASDSGTDGGSPECTSGTKKCVALTVHECVDETWTEQNTCPYICDNGTCKGVCEPGDTRCDGKDSQECGADGKWVTTTTCPYICSGDGDCMGSCAPNDKDCDGLVPRTCGADGEWDNGSACPYVCSGGDCTGVCVPTTNRCDGNKSQTCNAAGQWTTNQTCPYLCTGAGNCTGECSPTSKRCDDLTPQTCDANGFWQSGSDCPYVCDGGDCTGVCVPETDRCDGRDSQTCNASGQWQSTRTCPYVCTGEGDCTGECFPDTKSCQGDVPRTCNDQGEWVEGSECEFVCMGGNCMGVCEPGDTMCQGEQIRTCTAVGQWGGPGNCDAVPGADSYCDAGSCTYACDLDYDDCDGNTDNGCEVNLSTDTDHCGSCDNYCCGGTCTDGACGVNVTGLYGNYEVDDENLYWVEGRDLNRRSRTGNGSDATTMNTLPAGNIDDIDSNGTLIFWTQDADTDSGLYAMPVEGGDIVKYNSSAKDDELVLGPDRALYHVSGGNWVGYELIDEPYQSAGGAGFDQQPTYYVSDGTYMYVASGSLQPLQRYQYTFPQTKDDFVTSEASNYEFGRLAIDSTNLYYIFFNAITPSENGVWKKPLSGGSPTQLAAVPNVWSIATDGEYVYYAEHVGSGNMNIQRVPVGGGDSELLVNRASIFDIKLAGGCVYWNEYGQVHAISGAP